MSFHLERNFSVWKNIWKSPLGKTIGFPGGSVVKNLQCRRCRFDFWVGKIPWRRKWHPTPVFLLGNSMDRGAWWATVHGVTKSQTGLSNYNNCNPIRSVRVVQFLGFTTECSRAWRLEDAWIYHSAKILSSYLCEILKERSWFRMAETRDRQKTQAKT